jgi:Tfp pilus assembly protein PilV
MSGDEAPGSAMVALKHPTAGQPRFADGGATLIEHVIAVAVLAVVVTSVLTLLSVGYLAENLAQDQSLAVNLAQQKLEEIRAGGVEAAAPAERQPVALAASGGYEWQVEVTDVAPRLRQVTAIVYWKTRGRERSVTLVTLLGGR